MNNSFLIGGVLYQEHQWKVGIITLLLTTALIVSPLIYHIFSPIIKICPQLVAMFLGCILGTVLACVPEMPVFTEIDAAADPIRVLCFYFPVILLKHIYYLDTYILRKAFAQIFITAVVGWISFNICFGFLLITFVTVDTISFHIIVLAGLCFVPIEVPTDLFELDKLSYLEIIMYGETVLSTSFSLITFRLLEDHFDGVYKVWHQPLVILLKQITFSIVVGLPLGLLAGFIFKRASNNAINTTICLCTSIYLLFNLSEYVVECNPEMTCFIYMYCISKERGEIPRDVDRDICRLIKMLYTVVAISVYFAMLAVLFARMFFLYTLVSLAISVAVYTCGNVIRFVVLLLISPVLSRVGYECNFKVLVTMVWGIRKGPACILLTLMMFDTDLHNILGHEVIHLGFNYMLLVNFVNGLSLNLLMRKLGISEKILKNRNNIRNILNYIKKRKTNQLTVMKMNRFYSDANWSIIETATSLQKGRRGSSVSNKVGNIDEEDEEEFETVYKTRQTYCKSCNMNVTLESSKKEFTAMLKEVKLRILKSTKITFIRQYERGYLDPPELRTLLHAVELAQDSEDTLIKVDELLVRMKNRKQNRFIKRLRLMGKLAAIHHEPPPKRLNRIFYKIMKNKYFIISINFVILANIVLITMHLFMNWDHPKFQLINVSFVILYFIEFFIKLLGHTKKSTRQGFRSYWKSIWNKIDFLLLVLGAIDVIVEIILCFTYRPQNEVSYVIIYLRVLKFLRILRLLRLVNMFYTLYPAFLMYIEKLLDQKIMQCYIVGQALVITYEQIVEILPKVTDNLKIRDSLRQKLESDKNAIARELGLIEKDRPWVTITVKTHQCLIATMKIISHTINLLQSAGLIDSYELNKLNNVLAKRWKVVMSCKYVAVLAPKLVLYEVPWLDNDDSIFNYLYQNVSSRIWDAGDVIYDEGDIAEGVIVLVSGMFKITYIPEKISLEMLKSRGILPVKDYLRHVRFGTPQEEYVFKGNSIGELSVITGRPYNCRIIAETPSQAFVIPSANIMEAMQLKKDPINGLWSKIWKHISVNLAKPLFKDSPIYTRLNYHQLASVLSRAFVPNFEGYKCLVLNDLIENAVLIEGTAINAITKEKFFAPCPLPRNAQKINLIKEELGPLAGKPKILLVPLRDVDEYEAMAELETQSELEETLSDSNFLGGYIGAHRIESLSLRKRALTSTSSASPAMKSSKKVFTKFVASQISLNVSVSQIKVKKQEEDPFTNFDPDSLVEPIDSDVPPEFIPFARKTMDET